MDHETTADRLPERSLKVGGMERALRLASRLPRWTVLALVLTFSAEAFARLDDTLTWHAPLDRPYLNELLWMRDSTGIRGRPEYRYQKWGMNNVGFRGPDVQFSPPVGRTRIATLGASETFGLYETEGREYPARLQSLLDSLTPDQYEVINASLPGMGLATMGPYYRRVVAPFHPQVVLLYPTPTFYLSPVPPSDLAEKPAPRQEPEIGRFDRGFFQSRMAEKARESAKQIIPTVLITWFRDRQLSRIRSAEPAGWTWSVPPAERMSLFEKDLRTVFAAIQSSGAVAVLITHTNRFVGLDSAAARLQRRHLVNLMAKYFPRASEASLISIDSVANAIARRVAAESGAKVIEAEGRVPHGDQYFADYAHFTDQGADVMAHLIARSLREKGAGKTQAERLPGH